MFSNLGGWIANNIPAALQTLQNVWQSIWNVILAVTNAVFPIIRSMFTAFRAAIQGDWYAFGSNLRNTWDTTWKLIAQIAGNAWNMLKSAVSTLITNVINTFKTTDWGAVGKAIIDGIANGIRNAVGALVTAAQNAARAALDAAKGFLKIKSPSQVFEQQVGANLMAGWVRGIERMTPRLEAAVVGASGRAVMAATTNNYYNLTVQSVRSAEQIERDFWLMRG